MHIVSRYLPSDSNTHTNMLLHYGAPIFFTNILKLSMEGKKKPQVLQYIIYFTIFLCQLHFIRYKIYMCTTHHIYQGYIVRMHIFIYFAYFTYLCNCMSIKCKFFCVFLKEQIFQSIFYIEKIRNIFNKKIRKFYCYLLDFILLNCQKPCWQCGCWNETSGSGSMMNFQKDELPKKENLKEIERQQILIKSFVKVTNDQTTPLQVILNTYKKCNWNKIHLELLRAVIHFIWKAINLTILYIIPEHANHIVRCKSKLQIILQLYSNPH